MKTSQIEYLCLSSIIDYIYNRVINKSSYYDKQIEDFLAKTTIHEKALKTILNVNTIFKIASDNDVICKYPGIMCRHHIKRVNKKYDLNYDNINKLYYHLCDNVILEYNGFKKLVPIKAIQNHEEIIKSFKTQPQLVCADCKYEIDKKISDKYYNTNSSFGICLGCDQLLCETCLFSKNHTSYESESESDS